MRKSMLCVRYPKPAMAELVQIRDRRAPPAGGFALFEMGFRPFFLGAGALAALSLAQWLTAYAGFFVVSGGWAPPWLHAHEMVYGFGAAAVAGFLLTATPSWTQTRPLSGAPLVGLFALWSAPRVLFFANAPSLLLAIADLPFLPLLWLALFPAIRRGKPKNYVFLALLGVAAGGNVLCHLDALGVHAGVMRVGLKAGIYAIVMMAVILAGRIVPGFTENALRRRGQPHATTTAARVDKAAKALTLAALASDLFTLAAPLTGGLAAAAAALLLWRMRGWRTLQTLSEPIVWILHAGHLLLAIAFTCLSLDTFTQLFLASSALHAFTAGAIGCTVLGIMTRASLGHTGRPLTVPTSIVVAYLLVLSGALLRIFGALLDPGAYRLSVLVGGALWALGYAVFTFVYAPILVAPRVDR